MNCPFCRYTACIVGVAALGISLAFAQNPPSNKPTPKPSTPPAKAPSAQPPKTAATPPAGEMPPLPPGWTEADMQACIAAGTPGPEHQKLAQCVGVWQGTNKMWMAPDTQPAEGTVKTNITTIMDGRFVKCEVSGECPTMGPFSGLGIYGFDNVTKTYQATWIDNMGTTQMTGKGEASTDGKTITWTYHYTCPVSKKPTTMREVHTKTGADTEKMEIFGVEPKSGKEFKMMEASLTRKPGSGGATAIGSER